MFCVPSSGIPTALDLCLANTSSYASGVLDTSMASLAFMLTPLGLSYAQGFAEQCRNFQISIPDVQVNVLEFVPGGTNLTFPYDVCSLAANIACFP